MRRKFYYKYSETVRTAMLAFLIFIVPVCAAILFVVIVRLIVAQPPSSVEQYAYAMQITNRLHDGSAVGVTQLLALRSDMREVGCDTAEVDLRLWAAAAQEPTCVFKVEPPDRRTTWEWRLAQDYSHVLAVAQSAESGRQRRVGLYNLLAEEWVWTNTIPWPQRCAPPVVLGGRLIQRYSVNNVHFVMEVDEGGEIVAIERGGGGGGAGEVPVAVTSPVGGRLIAKRDNLLFIEVAADNSLQAFVDSALPGLRSAGRANPHTTLSGNGLLKFTVDDGKIAVRDALTGTVLQAWDGWPSTTNTTITAAQATDNGDLFNLFLATEFNGTTAIKREWSIEVDTYAGTLKRNLNPDVQFAKPPTVTNTLGVATPDGRWHFAVRGANILVITEGVGDRLVVQVDLKEFGVSEAVTALEFLAGGRYLLMRQEEQVWLLDYALVSCYGRILSRLQSAEKSVTLEAWRVKRERVSSDGANLALAEGGFGVQSDYEEEDADYFNVDTESVAPAWLALKAELLVANNVWGYAAATLMRVEKLQAYDSRAPRINPLLLARCQMMAGQREDALRSCRAALQSLMMLPVTYDAYTGERKPVANITPSDNKMVRYHLQGLLFAK